MDRSVYNEDLVDDYASSIGERRKSTDAVDSTYFFDLVFKSRAIKQLKSLEKVATSIIQSKQAAFRCKDDKTIIPSADGRKLVNLLLDSDMCRFVEAHPSCRLSPVLKTILDPFIQQGWFNTFHSSCSFHVHGGAQCIADALNSFVENIRREANTEDFKKILKNHKRNANKCKRGMDTLVDDIFKVYARVLVIRLDVSFAQIEQPFTNPLDVTHERASTDFTKLLGDIRYNLYKENFITYVWKLEYGFLKGYHYHVFLFFDGSKVRKDINICQAIGEHWKHKITKGEGSYYNCNACKAVYSKLGVYGIGMVDHRDVNKIGKLKEKALAYLVKTDHLVRTVANDKIRTFGKGASPKVAENRRGRPRLNSLVSAIR